MLALSISVYKTLFYIGNKIKYYVNIVIYPLPKRSIFGHLNHVIQHVSFFDGTQNEMYFYIVLTKTIFI